MAPDDIVLDTITLYFWPTANGQKVAILLEEIGDPYEIQFIDINAGAQFEPAFLAMSPNNKIPAIIDHDGPDGNPLAIFESGAILQYLGRKYELHYPTAERRKAEVDQWLFWQVGGLGPMAGQSLHFRKYAAEKVDYGIEHYGAEVVRLLSVMERQLARKPYLAGDFSIADIAAFPWIRRHDDLGIALADFPNIAVWYERIAARPAVKRALEIGSDPAKRLNAVYKAGAPSLSAGT